MKLATATNDTIATRGVQTKTHFKVATNAKMFSILFDKHYPDKPKAVIRELSTNAVDSHIDAGNLHIPYVVNLPTTSNPTFSIRDYGTGMSREKIEDLYVTAGISDKDEDNDREGCFGLGSKSPFAYVNSFYVTSYYNGKVYYYIANKVNGLPDIDFMHEDDTDEPNGLEVGLSVRPGDVYEFQSTAARVYKYFKHRPTITGADFEFEDVEPILQGEGWSVVGGDSVAIMGNIGYPIVASRFLEGNDGDIHPNAPVRYKPKASDSTYYDLLCLGLHLEFGIGEVEMTSNREELEYIAHTKDSIRAKLDDVRAKIGQVINDKFNSCANMYEARLLYSGFDGDYNFKKMLKLVDVTFRGEKVEPNVELRDSYNHIDNIPGTTISSSTKYLTKDSIKRESSISYINVEKDEYVFIENDLKAGIHNRVRAYLLPLAKEKAKKAYIVKFDDDTAKKTFCEWMGFDESYLIKGSDLPKPPKKVPGERCNEKVFIFNGNTSHYYDPKDAWDAEDVDIEDGGVYTELYRYSANAGSFRPSTIRSVLDGFKNLQIATEPIIGVKQASAKKFKTSEDWVDMMAYFRTTFEEYIQTNKLESIITSINTINNSDKAEDFINLAKSSRVKLNNGTDIYEYITKLKNMKRIGEKQAEEVKTVLDIASRIGYNLTDGSQKAAEALDAEAEQLIEKYPILKLVSSYNWNDADDSTIAVTYINKDNS